MMGLRIALVASAFMVGLMGCASSHTRTKHVYVHPKHSYGGTHGHIYSHPHGYPTSSRHGHHPAERHYYHRKYHRPPPPQPGRTPDGRYVLPGGLESVCAGGTPPPCR
jgi:hypothetical protein